MKKLVFMTMCLFPLMGIGQGIQFDSKQNSWKQVLETAKKENKYIFVDYMATWCGPCKKMEAEVYPDTELGLFASANFLSVKVQGDSSKADLPRIIDWYADAKSLGQQFNVTAYPTYLFFSPNGKLVLREKGFKTVADFMTLLKRAIENRDYLLIEDYRQHRLDIKKMPEAIQAAELLGNETLVSEMGHDYVINYLMTLPKQELYTKGNLATLGKFVRIADKVAFSMFLKDSIAINKVLGDDASRGVLIRAVRDDLIHSKLYKDGNPKNEIVFAKPDWNSYYKQIVKVTNADIAKRAIIRSRVSYYQKQRNHLEFSRAIVDFYDNYGYPDRGVPAMLKVNNVVYETIVMHVKDKKVLSRAAEWMKVIIANEPAGDWKASYMDTYANVLYKMGEVTKAIEVETQAKALVKDPKSIKEYEGTIEKFKNGTQTWKVSN